MSFEYLIKDTPLNENNSLNNGLRNENYSVQLNLQEMRMKDLFFVISIFLV